MEGQDAFQTNEINKASLAKSRIYHYFNDQANIDRFLRTLYILIRQTGISSNDIMVHEIASDLLNDIVEEALSHSDRYDPTRLLAPWLYGVARNVIKRKKDKLIKSVQKEVSLSQFEQSHDGLNEQSSLDHWALFATDGPEAIVEDREQYSLYLRAFTQLSENDQHMISLALHSKLNYEQLAKEFGITPAAARQRFHRATTRLRNIIYPRGGQSNG